MEREDQSYGSGTMRIGKRSAMAKHTVLTEVRRRGKTRERRREENSQFQTPSSVGAPVIKGWGT